MHSLDQNPSSVSGGLVGGTKFLKETLDGGIGLLSMLRVASPRVLPPDMFCPRVLRP